MPEFVQATTQPTRWASLLLGILLGMRGTAPTTTEFGEAYQHYLTSATAYQEGNKFVGGVRVGAAGGLLTQVRIFFPELTPPLSVPAQSVTEQTFSVPGLSASDKALVNPPLIGNATGIVSARASATDTLALRFINPTAGALTPSSGVCVVMALRS